MEDNNREIINGANPSIVWTQFYDALSLISKQMKAEYTKRMRANNPFTWNDIDVINKKIHDKLDYIMTWNDELKNESINKKNVVRLTESDLHRIVAESVNRLLNEGRGTLGYMVDEVTNKFNEFYLAHKRETDDYIKRLKESGNFKDLETRLAWDIARVVKYRDWMPVDEKGFINATDAQITTLFKQALRKSNINY